MKNALLLLLIFLGSSLTLPAQKATKIAWGPKYDHKGLYQMIGKSGEYIFVAHLGRSYSTKNPNLKIFKYDSNKQIKAEYNLKDIIGKKSKLIDVQATEDMIYALVFNEEKKKKQVIEKLEIDPASMKVNSRLRIMSFKEQFEFVPQGYSTGFWSSSKRTINYLTSEAGNKLGLVIMNEKKKFIKAKILILDRNNFYGEVNQLELKLEDDKESASIVDYFIREDGSLSVLKKHYWNSKRKDKHKGHPDYAFEVIRKPLNGEKTMLEIRDDDLFLNGAKITDDEEGNTFFAALYERKHGKGAEGTAIYKINASNELVLNVKNKSTLIREKKDKLKKNLQVTNFFKAGDKYIVMYRELETKWRSTGNNNRGGTGISFSVTRSFPVYFSREAVIEAFDINGKHQWSNVIHQKTTQAYTNICTRYITHFSDNQIMIFANMHKNNIKDLNHENPKHRNMPNNDNVITKITIDLDGNMKFNPLCEPWEIFIGKGSTKVIGDQIYIVGFQEKFDNLRLGTIPLNL